MAALTARCTELRVYENGVGALNLAQTHSQRGAMTTRAMRPEMLCRMQHFIRELFGVPFRIVNPNAMQTKAEMVARAPRSLDALIRRSRSCDTAMSGRRPRNAPCGRCTSCVLRRQALLAGGRNDLDADDLAMMNGDSLRAHPGHVDGALRLMLGQVATLNSCLASGDPWLALVRRWPDLIDAQKALNVDSTAVVDLFARYCAEWHFMDAALVRHMLRAA